MLKTLIVDDELPGAQTLQLMLETYCPSIQVLAVATSVQQALDCMREQQPALVFLDIELTSGSGFELLQHPESKSVEVIFTTAYQQYAIRAFRSNAVDYLLKPVDPDELIAAVTKARRRMAEKAEPLWQGQAAAAPRSRRIALPSFEAIHYVETEDVIRLEAASNYTDIYLTGGRRHTVTRTLKEFEALLLPELFCRVHKAHLVHLHFVEKFVRAEGGYLLMKDGTTVPVSRQKKEEVLRKLEG